jgi:signal transduction histidine kinase
MSPNVSPVKNAFQNRFQLQLLFALIAAVSVAALTIQLAVNAVRHAEGVVLSDTSRALNHALEELSREYRLQRSGDSSWAELPFCAQDLTLRAISQTVLGSYPGVEGGFWGPAQFVGYAYPTHDGGLPKTDVPAAERSAIENVVRRAQREGRNAQVLRGKYDLLVISAVSVPDSGGPGVAWAMKLLPEQAEPAERTRGLLLAALICAALLGAAGVLATGIGLNRGVAQIKRGLAAIDKNFVPDLPVRRDELGQISAAINEMARTRRRLEAEIRREDRARTIGLLVGRIAHEIRNPLNSIRLSLQMLAHRQMQDRLHPEDFQTVIEEVDRMNQLLSGVLAFEQPPPPKIEYRQVRPILEKCAQLVMPQAKKQGVGLLISGDVDRPAAMDEQYVRQIVVNLLLNAIDVSEEGGRVSMGTKEDGNGGVAIEVSDQGPGLTAEQKEHLFEPFFTTKVNGHGLGLAVSRELARGMGANLFYRNGSAHGTTFVLQFKDTPNEEHSGE